jgi:hypothetical protein
MNAWLALRRPLLLLLFIGCAVSFLTSHILTLRLVLPGAINWSFVPAVEIGALAVVCRRDRRTVLFPQLIDSFFRGYRPWMLWLSGICAIWCLLSPAAKPLDWSISVAWLDGGAVVAIAWSLYIDFCFFRSVLQRNRFRAARDLTLQRLLSWSPIMAVVAAPTIWSDVMGRLW